jgi:hypothetical protein
MRGVRNAAAGGASLVFIILAARSGALARGPSLQPVDQDASPPSYTFRLDVAMAMRHFPWLHFHLEGLGLYAPGVSYVVHFTSVPWFIPNARHDADLSMLDPSMWPRRFIYEEIGSRGGDRIFSLQAINDPTLRRATVTLDPNGSARHVDATYSDGSHVEMQVRSSNVDGFVLPMAMIAEIDEPHIALSANADFKDYDFAGEPQAQTNLPVAW